MPKIFELEPHVADLIAAGEVVERPASVVKELTENSIDAGAGIITVEISAGGMTYIRVTDDGCGIAPEDAGTAFLRHATSKLKGADGLEAIGTLGFRGEALAAIAAVSRIGLLTREAGAQEGVSLTLEAGEATGRSPAGCPEGTTIIVRDLFFNTPARLKFMKSDRAEGAGAAAAVLRCALSHPEVSMRLIRDGKTEYHTPGDSRIDSCIYSLFGREFFAGLIKTETEDETLSVTGYISSPGSARGNRSYQYFFVNGRSIRSKTLQAALEQAYANTLPSGRYPACVLYIKTRLGDVDVNVHPAKTEIKFVSDKQVFDGVYYAALGALHSTQPVDDGGSPQPGIPGDLPGAGAASRIRGQSGGFAKMTADEFNSKYKKPRSPAASFTVDDFSGLKPPPAPDAVYQTEIPGPGSALRTPDSILRSPELSYQTQLDMTRDEEPEALSGGPYRVIGEAMNTYIVAEYRGSLWLIDKHAAHERIHFDALRSEGFTPMSQSLIAPVVCRHGNEDASLLLENSELLDKLGFDVGSFGDDSVAVRAIPAEIDIGDVEPVLSDICAKIKSGGTAEPAGLDNIYRTIACKAAIKAGKSSGIRELKELTARVLSGEISRCPHGRPVAFEITKTTLDRNFKRI